jgi:hypothetical protein
VSDAKLTIEINLDKRTFSSENTATQTKQPSQPLPEGGMPWMLQVDTDPQEASDIRVDALTEQVETFNPVNATACSVIALDAWITDKFFETHDDTIYVVRVVNTSSHYVAEEICVDLEIDPKCAAVAMLLPDQHSLIEIQPIHQCIKCLAPRHYIDLKFVAISRGPMPGVFPVRACVSYDLVYWTRAQARTHARLEIEVHDECRPRRDPCRTPRHVPPDPGDFKPALQPQCPVELFKPCCEPAKSKPLPSVEDCGCDDGVVPGEATPSEQQAPTQDAPAEATKPPLAVTPAATPAATVPAATARQRRRRPRRCCRRRRRRKVHRANNRRMSNRWFASATSSHLECQSKRIKGKNGTPCRTRSTGRSKTITTTINTTIITTINTTRTTRRTRRTRLRTRRDARRLARTRMSSSRSLRTAGCPKGGCSRSPTPSARAS